MEFLLMFKFCRKFDEDENAYVGGVTICECLTNLLAKKRVDENVHHTEEIIVEVDEVVEDEYADNEAHMKLPVEPLNQKP